VGIEVHINRGWKELRRASPTGSWWKNSSTGYAVAGAKFQKPRRTSAAGRNGRFHNKKARLKSRAFSSIALIEGWIRIKYSLAVLMMVVVAIEEERQVQVGQFGSQVAHAAQKQQRGKRKGGGLFHNQQVIGYWRIAMQRYG
jgi:hypothetical protein